MITIGLTTWSGHPLFTSDPQNPKSKSTLKQYSANLPTVEVDMPFYYVPSVTVIQHWQEQVPSDFQFILKANRVMTRHDYRHPAAVDTRRSTFARFKQAVQPLVKYQQLKTILFQFPPYFQREARTVQYLKKVRQLMGKLPITVEFRNPSWYKDRAITVSVARLLAHLRMTEAIVDEPHNVNNGIPFIPTITNHHLVLLRLHGRNSYGWFHQGKEWRKTRTLYSYGNQELRDLAHLVKQLSQGVREVCIIFNNNSAKDAAPNAMSLKKLLHLQYHHLAPRQMGLF